MHGIKIQSDTGKQNTDDKVLGGEHELCLDGFVPSKSKMMYTHPYKRLYSSREAHQELDTRTLTTIGRTIHRMAISLTITCLTICVRMGGRDLKLMKKTEVLN